MDWSGRQYYRRQQVGFYLAAVGVQRAHRRPVAAALGQVIPRHLVHARLKHLQAEER